MKRLIWLVGIVVVIVGGLGVAGLLLPGTHTVSVSRVMRGTPEEVWSVVTDVEAFPSWRPDVERVEVLPRWRGLPSWREFGSSGPMTLRTTESTPFFRLSTEIADEDAGYGGSWTWELVAQPSGTQVTLTENGEIYSPFLRVFAYVFMDPEESVSDYLDALERRMADRG